MSAGMVKRDRCEFCLRPKAVAQDYETYVGGEAEHLCWDGLNGCEGIMYDNLRAWAKVIDEGGIVILGGQNIWHLKDPTPSTLIGEGP